MAALRALQMQHWGKTSIFSDSRDCHQRSVTLWVTGTILLAYLFELTPH